MSNSPRSSALRLLDELWLRDFFPSPDTFDPLERYQEWHVFAIEDLLPDARPEPRAWGTVFRKAYHAEAHATIYVDDSIENLRAAKRLGMRTVLISGGGNDGNLERAVQKCDAAVDVSVERVEDVFKVLHVVGYEGVNCAKKPDFRRSLEFDEAPDDSPDDFRDFLPAAAETAPAEGGAAAMDYGDAALDGFLSDNVGYVSEAWLNTPQCNLQGWSIVPPPVPQSETPTEHAASESGGESSGSQWELWVATWRMRLNEWWIGLPQATATKLQHCATFLGGVLTSRLDLWLARLKRMASQAQLAAAATPPPASASANECTRLVKAIEHKLPAFPEPPNLKFWDFPLPLRKLVPKNLVVGEAIDWPSAEVAPAVVTPPLGAPQTRPFERHREPHHTLPLDEKLSSSKGGRSAPNLATSIAFGGAAGFLLSASLLSCKASYWRRRRFRSV
jgi:hypothetical protein|tara:strand:+ start:656 stop:1996 length:1341 start_codon:yes stop_codon:yes gene_type:complete